MDDTAGRLDYPLDIDYISNLERSTFFGHSREAEVGAAFDDGKVLNWGDLYAGGVVDPAVSDYHLRFFMAHVLHVIVVARKFGYDENKALGQLCIGANSYEFQVCAAVWPFVHLNISANFTISRYY